MLHKIKNTAVIAARRRGPKQQPPEPSAGEPRSHELRFRSEQMTNLMENYERVDDTVNELIGKLKAVSEELPQLRERVSSLTTSLQRERQRVECLQSERDQILHRLGLAQAALKAAALPATEDFDQVTRLATETYRCAVHIVGSPNALSTARRLRSGAVAFAGAGVAGMVEKIDERGGRPVCRGWATKPAETEAQLLVTIHDRKGCLGYGMPFAERADVAQVLPNSDMACGFSIPLIRRPVGPVKACLNMFTAGKLSSWSLSPYQPDALSSRGPATEEAMSS